MRDTARCRHRTVGKRDHRFRIPHRGAEPRIRAQCAMMFDGVATRYDLMNDLMSGGVHRLWKAAMIDWIAPQPGQTLVDLAGGTGDISLRFLRAGGSQAVVTDINESMLTAGRQRRSSANMPIGSDGVSAMRKRCPSPMPAPISSPLPSGFAMSPTGTRRLPKRIVFCSPAAVPVPGILAGEQRHAGARL